MPLKEESSRIRLISHNQLNGYGNGGEGLALQQLPGGRRVLYMAHESAPKDFTVIDVTDVKNPRVLLQTELPHQNIRSNSLAIVGDVLLVAYQVARPGLTPAGMGVYDIQDPEAPRQIAFFDTSGPNSRGVHCLWWVDGRYAHLSTGAADHVPSNPKDDQFYMIVDVGDPTNPTEVGRWWLPGTAEGDSATPPVRHPQFDSGFRLHNGNVYPQRPDRAYLGYLDAGVIILDISDMSRPKMISRVDYHPPFPGFTHTVLPLFEKGLLVVTDEAIRNHGEDWPKLVWVMDVREEANPVIISTLPMPNKEEFFQRGGRFGAHNIHENQPVSSSWSSETTIVGAYFNGGVRVHDISDPFRPEEVAHFIPVTPEGQPEPQINDVYVDETGLVYAIDRIKGGLYILELEA